MRKCWRLPVAATMFCLSMVMQTTDNALASSNRNYRAPGGTPHSRSVWGNASIVPGLVALEAGGVGGGGPISCSAPGDCSVVGAYATPTGTEDNFGSNEVDGSWGGAAPIGIPGVGGPPDPPLSGTISCVSPGNCSAVGPPYDVGMTGAVSEVDGTWQTPVRVSGGGTWLPSVSCGSPGNCLAIGDGRIQSERFAAFLVAEVDGVWQQPFDIPGLATLNIGNSAEVTSVSCPSAGNCAVSGYYSRLAMGPDAYDQLPFVENEVAGTWGDATEIPGIESFNTPGGGASAVSISCAAAGDCVVVGVASGLSFLATEANGTWGDVRAVAGAENFLASGPVAEITCPTVGDCTAGGPGFIVGELHDFWGVARAVPGLAKLSPGGSTLQSISCAAAGRCAAAGDYVDVSGRTEAFVAVEFDGLWGNATEVRGLNPGPATSVAVSGVPALQIQVSCAPTGYCGAAGSYHKGWGLSQDFVVNGALVGRARPRWMPEGVSATHGSG